MVGDKYGPLIVPEKFDKDTYLSLINVAKDSGESTDMLEQLYVINDNEFVLQTNIKWVVI